MTQLRRWYIEDGKIGQPLENQHLLEAALTLKIYPGLLLQYDARVVTLAALFERDPAEVEQWEWRWINELLMVKQAQTEAARHAQQPKKK